MYCESRSSTVEKLRKIPALPWHAVWRAAEKLGAAHPKHPVIFECVGVPGVIDSIIDGAPLFSRVVVVGVCVGMQMLLSRSEEGPTDGLGLIPGDVRRFRLEGRTQTDGSRYKVPQMGWNRVLQVRAHPVWGEVPDGAFFYFVHSFYAHPDDPAHSVGETEYGVRFTCALARDNIFATQFHPEKSAAHGLALYRNFLRWTP